MRAVRITAPGRAEVVSLPCPGAVPGEVVADVSWAAVCGTDRKLVARGATAAVPGHEVAGELADGTAVGIHPDTGCGRCAQCRAGRTNRCPRKVSVGIDRDGGLAGRVRVPEAHVVPLDGVDPSVAPLLEPLACAVHAERRLPDGGDTVVVGAGAMGIMVMWALQAAGRRVVVRQRSAARRVLAAELGATAVFGANDDLPEVLAGPLASVVVTAPGADALAWALSTVAEGGTVHAFAGSPGGALIDANTVHYRHLDLVGSTGSGIADYRRALELVRSGAVPLHRLPRTATDLDGAVAALVAPPQGRHLRTVIELTGADR
jgi:threonine dehydrogenase-like Zn-dependent dehydrogenase